jgi:benzodiazapine receptor
METMRGGTSGRRGVAGLLTVAAVTTATALAGSLAGDFESTWYRRLRKPSWQPSGRTIGLVWTGLYTLTAASAVLLLRAPGPGPRRLLGGLFGLQYLLNAAFTPIFTRRRDLTLATVDSALLCATLSLLTGLGWRVRRAAAALLLPSVAWTAFATFLSWKLLRLNRR